MMAATQRVKAMTQADNRAGKLVDAMQGYGI